MPEKDFSVESAARLRVESLPFPAIPGQSKLFLDYLSDPVSLKRFYPSAVASHTLVAERVPEVISAYSVDRKGLCDVLEEQNRAFGASQNSLQNLALLRGEKTVSVLTGQQAGLFTGPLYTVYKALSAIKMAQCLRGRGIDAVPVFWTASEDHDFDEVATATVLERDGATFSVAYEPSDPPAGRSVGAIELDGSVQTCVDRILGSLPKTEFSERLRDELSSAYRPGRSFAAAFATLIAKLFGQFGLIVVDPMDARLKRMASPIYSAGAKAAGEIVEALRERGANLVESGYHSQVLVTDDYFPLFWHDQQGVRRSLKRRSDGSVWVNGERTVFSKDKLIAVVTEQPERFSPGVICRPIVQDFLFPTICYFGGGAEIAYFAQNSEAYRVLGRPVTPIFHRQSFTVVEHKQARTLLKFGLEFSDLFAGLDRHLPGIVERYLEPENARLFPEVEEKINTELNRLDRQLSDMDPTLAASLATRRRKIVYHLAALKEKYRRAALKKNEDANRQLTSLFTGLLPEGHLQERTLNATSFLDRHGDYFIDWIYAAVDLDDRGHRVVYL